MLSVYKYFNNTDHLYIFHYLCNLIDNDVFLKKSVSILGTLFHFGACFLCNSTNWLKDTPILFLLKNAK